MPNTILAQKIQSELKALRTRVEKLQTCKYYRFESRIAELIVVNAQIKALGKLRDRYEVRYAENN